MINRASIIGAAGISPHAALALAAIKTAIEDVRAGDPEALVWLNDGRPGGGFWYAEMLGGDSGWLDRQIDALEVETFGNPMNAWQPHERGVTP